MLARDQWPRFDPAPRSSLGEGVHTIHLLLQGRVLAIQ